MNGHCIQPMCFSVLFPSSCISLIPICDTETKRPSLQWNMILAPFAIVLFLLYKTHLTNFCVHTNQYIANSTYFAFCHLLLLIAEMHWLLNKEFFCFMVGNITKLQFQKKFYSDAVCTLCTRSISTPVHVQVKFSRAYEHELPKIDNIHFCSPDWGSMKHCGLLTYPFRWSLTYMGLNVVRKAEMFSIIVFASWWCAAEAICNARLCSSAEAL